MSGRPVIDVSELPHHAFDARAPLWWGNLLMIVIETTITAGVIASYFYLKQNFTVWPPPRHEPPTILRPLPELGVSTANLLLLAASVLPMWLADRAARRLDARATCVALFVAVALGVVAIVLRAYEFPATHFRWDSNAYGSVVWAALGFHLLHLVSSTGETLLLASWVAAKGLDEKHALDATVNAVYWYWMVGVWVPMFVVVYLFPRWV